MLALKLFIFVVILVYHVDSLAKLEEVFAWKGLTLAWPNDGAKNAAIKSGEYIPAHTIPLGMEIWKNKLFFTIPRWKSNVPITLGYVNINDTSKSPSLIPYPSWEANAAPKNGKPFKDDNHIYTTFRVAVDKCDRLWVMDMGLINILDDYQELFPPSILIYDLNTDKLIKKHVLDKDVLRPGAFFDASFFPNIVIESNKDRCDDAYAYLPDVAAYALVVYSLKQDEAWRFKHNFFYFDPLHGNFNSGGYNFQWRDGVFGLALGPEDEHCDRTMYFHPSASWNEFSVNTGVLKNKTLADNPANYYLFKNEGLKGENTQTTGSVFDEKSNTLFLTQLNRDGVACWNPKKPLKPENVPMIAEDHEKLIFTNEIRIDNERYLWILSNKMPQFLYGKLDYNEVNYRLFKVKVDDAIAGTACVA